MAVGLRCSRGGRDRVARYASGSHPTARLATRKGLWQLGVLAPGSASFESILCIWDKCSRDGLAAQQAAKITGTNRQYVADAKKLKAEAPCGNNKKARRCYANNNDGLGLRASCPGKDSSAILQMSSDDICEPSATRHHPANACGHQEKR